MHRIRGFTLVELIVILAITAIVVTQAIPGFGHLVAHERRVSTVFSMVHALNLARSRALMTGHYVAVCKSDNQKQCSKGAVTWSDGWIVFMNLDRDWQVDSGETILLQHGPLDRGVTLVGNRNAFNFRPRSVRSTAGSLFACAANGADGTAVIVSVTGRVRTSPEKANGSPVVCP